MKTATYSTIVETLDKIDAFAALEPDWDSYGGKTIATGAIESAKNLINALASTTTPRLRERALSVWVAPVPNGNVLLEWQGPSVDLEVEVTASGALEILLTAHTANGDTYTEESNVGLQDVASLLDKVLSA